MDDVIVPVEELMRQQQENLIMALSALGVLIIVLPLSILFTLWRLRTMVHPRLSLQAIKPCEVDDRKTLIEVTVSRSRFFFPPLISGETFRGSGDRWRRASNRTLCTSEEQAWIEEVLAKQKEGAVTPPEVGS